MSVISKTVRSSRTNKRNSLKEIFYYFRWKSFEREKLKRVLTEDKEEVMK